MRAMLVALCALTLTPAPFGACDSASGCKDDFDCDGASVCKVSTGACEAFVCKTADDCDGGKTCNDNVCE